jgi:hypothetical protein
MWTRYILAAAVLLVPGGSLLLVAAAAIHGLRERRAQPIPTRQ